MSKMNQEKRAMATSGSNGGQFAKRIHGQGKPMYWLCLSLTLLLADQISKQVVSIALAYEERIPVMPFFAWVHRHNSGAAFSFLADAGGWQRPFFIGLALVFSLVLSYWLWRSPRVMSYRLGLSAIIGGSLGNALDRFRLGYVEDFLDFYYAQGHWPSFNLADVWIVCGAALLIWVDVRGQSGHRRA